MDVELLLLLLTGFVAQLVDGALGMAFGVISTSVVMSLGMPAAQASALVHTAEMFTTSASGAWHIYHRNVDWWLTAKLASAGVIGALIGAWLLSNIDAMAIRPFVSAYLLLVGLYLLFKVARGIPAQSKPRSEWPVPIGLVAGFLDASGGGGWGPVATSSLLGAGHAPRRAIGSVNTAEFFVTVAAAATFFFELGLAPWQQFVPLVLGGIFAAPLGGWAARRLPARALMSAVGVLIVALAAWQLTHPLALD
jgi:uncharacterized membrane protein YfcA